MIMNGSEVEQTVKTIGTTFDSQINRLNQLDYNILDARASQWHNDYNSFKAIISVSLLSYMVLLFQLFEIAKGIHVHVKQDLDKMIINIINKAFDEVKVIETAVELLHNFHGFAFRPAIKVCVSKKSTDVKMLFKQQCQLIRKEFDDFHRKPPLRNNEPRFAGAALWAKALSCNVDDGWILVQNLTLVGNSDLDDIEMFVHNLKIDLYSYQSQKYRNWLETLSNMDSTSFNESLNKVSFSTSTETLLQNGMPLN